MLWTSTHNSSGTLSDRIPWIYHFYCIIIRDLIWFISEWPSSFPYFFFNLSLNFAIRSSWSEPQSAPRGNTGGQNTMLHLRNQQKKQIRGERHKRDAAAPFCYVWRVFSFRGALRLCPQELTRSGLAASARIHSVLSEPPVKPPLLVFIFILWYASYNLEYFTPSYFQVFASACRSSLFRMTVRYIKR